MKKLEKVGKEEQARLTAAGITQAVHPRCQSRQKTQAFGIECLPAQV
jgi:hypothetical protein